MRLKTFLCSSVLLLTFFYSFAQQKSFYVVVGVFKNEQNAKRLLEYVYSLNLPAVYALNSEQDLYYVYARSTSQRQDANSVLKSVRVEGFKKAWIFEGILQEYIGYTEVTPVPPVEDKQNITTDQPEEKKSPEDVVIKTTVVDSVSVPAPEIVKPAGKPFMFKLVSSTTGQPVTGQVHLLESEKALQYVGYDANEIVHVISPKNRAGKWYVASNVVGFKPLKKSFVYNNPVQGSTVSVGNAQEIIIPLELTRVKKGDYIEMDNVKFYGNAAAITPESERELKELLAMMQENPSYRIRLHGHTNGNQGRDIIPLGEDKDLFHTDPDIKKISGSAKELSRLRAESVKLYLTNNGIDPSRISVKGEGGTQPIFDEVGTLAEGNDRVEVEITKS
jgi:outer membrane protein OmpA-like peptidoglycan-associated protein